jgi:hypothetical protein
MAFHFLQGLIAPKRPSLNGTPNAGYMAGPRPLGPQRWGWTTFKPAFWKSATPQGNSWVPSALKK